jgi:midasin
MIQQRQQLCESVKALDHFDGVMKDVTALATPREVTELPQYGCRRFTDVGQVLRWLPQIVRFSKHIVTTHAKLSGVDNRKDLEYLNKWLAELEGFAAEHRELIQLPSSFHTLKHADLESRIALMLGGKRDDMHNNPIYRPDLKFVYDQMRLWLECQYISSPEDSGRTTLDEFTESVMNASKKVLVAMQEIEKTSHTLPTTAEDASWLMNYQTGLTKMIKSLRIDTLTKEAAILVNLIQDLPKTTDRKPIYALLRVVLPLLQQYTTICTGRRAVWAIT